MFYSVATIAFYHMYGVGIYGDTKITRTCVAFSFIYLFYFLGLMVYYVVTTRESR
jgi:hypothetical protein